jgi:hypothetical protein
MTNVSPQLRDSTEAENACSPQADRRFSGRQRSRAIAGRCVAYSSDPQQHPSSRAS